MSRLSFNTKTNHAPQIKDITYAPTTKPIKQGTVFPGQAFNVER